MVEERSLGGNLNDAVRVGDTVRRRAGPWTPAVHALLRYLEGAGFEAPRVLGMDPHGREILGFIEGEAHSGTLAPLPDSILADARIVEAAQLLRRYHDVVSGFRPPPEARWRMVAPTGSELICHNDWTPWNALLRNGRVEVMLDWDLAGPGTRLWDVANGIYCWTPLFASHLLPSVDVQLRRVRLFVDAYGLEDRSALLPTLRSRLVFVGELVARQAAVGDVGMQRLVSMSVPKKMFEDDVGFLDRNWRAIERVL
jgi:hypothetical protein